MIKEEKEKLNRLKEKETINIYKTHANAKIEELLKEKSLYKKRENSW